MRATDPAAQRGGHAAEPRPVSQPGARQGGLTVIQFWARRISLSLFNAGLAAVIWSVWDVLEGMTPGADLFAYGVFWGCFIMPPWEPSE